MTNFIEPMLAASLLEPDIEHSDYNVYQAMKQLRYPVLATLKKDGMRGLRLNGTLLSRTLKKIPNVKVREGSTILSGGFDMELWNPQLEYNEIQSICMSRVHVNHHLIQYHILDCFFPEQPSIGYLQRLFLIQQVILECQWSEGGRIAFENPTECKDAEELFEFERQCIENHGEGICFRTPNSPYKMGRSTLDEQYLVKLSRYIRDEAVIIGFVEQMENGNLDAYNEVGKMKRSSAISGMCPKNTLGALRVRNTEGQEFPIGTGVGLTKKLRQEIWDNQKKYLNRTITYKCKPHGQKILPRSPIMVGFRDGGM